MYPGKIFFGFLNREWVLIVRVLCFRSCRIFLCIMFWIIWAAQFTVTLHPCCSSGKLNITYSTCVMYTTVAEIGVSKNYYFQIKWLVHPKWKFCHLRFMSLKKKIFFREKYGWALCSLINVYMWIKASIKSFHYMMWLHLFTIPWF